MAIRLILMPASSRKKRKDVENLILRKTPGLTRQQFKRDKHKAISDYVADQLVEMFQQSSSQAGVCRKHIEGGRT